MPRPPSAGWWGDGPPPWERWPGISLRLDAKWVQKRNRWESPDGRFYFDPAAAKLAVDFFPTFLRHYKGEFDAMAFELMPYQRDLVVMPVFGWKRSADGLRRFRKVLLFIPKKNGKSPLGSGVALKLLLADGEPGAEVYAAASDRRQARIVFDAAREMVTSSPLLSEQAEVYKGAIVVPGTHSTFQVLSADVRSSHGPNIHGLVFDEFHAQPDRELYESLSRGLASRQQPLLFLLTTAGDDDEGICFEEYEYARRVLSGTVIDERFLPVLFEASTDEDWTSPAVWRRVNPGLGVTVKEEFLAAECEAAQAEPRKRNDFLRYHCNRWTASATAWLPVEWWDACRCDLDDALLRQLPAWAGLDMAQKIDLCAFVVVFREYLTEALEVKVVTGGTDAGDAPGAPGPEEAARSLNYRVFVRPYFWLPEDTVRDREREGISYQAWADAGLLTVTDGASIDYDRVFRDITEKIVPSYPLLKQGQIGYDPAFATDIANRLRDKAGLTTVEVLQNYKYLSEPSYVFEALVKSKRVGHDGHRLMRWCVENAAIKTDDARRIRPVKPRKSNKKVDGVVATLMALSRLMVGGGSVAPVPSVYDERAARGEEDILRWV